MLTQMMDANRNVNIDKISSTNFAFTCFNNFCEAHKIVYCISVVQFCGYSTPRSAVSDSDMQEFGSNVATSVRVSLRRSGNYQKG
jgi:hypothetical protein